MTDKKNGLDKEVNSMAMPDNSGSEDDYREKLHSRPKKRILEIDSYKQGKSRQQLYDELRQDDEILDQDLFEYASHIGRGAALFLDVLFFFVLYKIVTFITPYLFKLTQYCLDAYKLEFMLGNGFLLRMILILTTIVVIFISVIIPMAFFNNSFGKKVFNLKVRGDETYSIAIDKAIIRELIAKPISAICIIGFIFPFFNKERKSLHDKFMKTFVIKG